MFWLFRRKCHLLVDNKFLKAAWTCGIQLWSRAAKIHNEIQVFHKKTQRNIMDGPFYFRNDHLRQRSEDRHSIRRDQKVDGKTQRRLHAHVKLYTAACGHHRVMEKIQKNQTYRAYIIYKCLSATGKHSVSVRNII